MVIIVISCLWAVFVSLLFRCLSSHYLCAFATGGFIRIEKSCFCAVRVERVRLRLILWPIVLLRPLLKAGGLV